MSTPRAAKVERYADLPSNATAYVLGTAGTVGYDHSLVSRASPLHGIGLQSAMSGKIQIYGQGADNDTVLVNVWGGADILQHGSSKLAYRELHYLGLITATLSAIVPSASNPLIVANPACSGALRWADTIVWTPSSVGTAPPGPMVVYEGASNRGAWTHYSPTVGNAGIAELVCPHFLSDMLLVLDFKVSDAAVNSGNAIITTSRP